MVSDERANQPSMDIEIAAQSQLISRMGLAFKGANKLSLLHGQIGVGKSYLAALLKNSINNTLVVNFLLKKSMEAEQLKQQIICELATDELSDLNQAIAVAVANAVLHHRQSILIIIDEAQLASQQLLSELWQSIHEFSQHNQTTYTFNVLLIGDSRWAKPLYHGLNNKTDSLVAEFEVPLLTAEQATHFMTAIHREWSVQQIAKYLAKTPAQYLTPQQLIYAQLPVASRENQRVILILTSLLVLLVIGGLVARYTLNKRVNPATTIVEEIIPRDQATIPLAEPIEPLSSQNKELLTRDIIQPTIEPLTAKVVLEDKIVLDDSAPELGSHHSDELIEDSPALAVPQDVVVTTSVVTPPLYQFDEGTLLAHPSEYYTLMLGGFSDLETLRRVSHGFTDKQQLTVYQGIRAKKPWFVLLYSHYVSRNEAIAFLNNHQALFTGLSPWAKSMKSIHAEINRDSLSKSVNK